MSTAEWIVRSVVHLALAAFWFWMGWRAGRKAFAKAAVDYVLAKAASHRNWEERMLDYAKLQDKAPRTKVIW